MKQKLEQNPPLNEIIEKIIQDKSIEKGIDTSQTKFLSLQQIKINNKLLQKNVYYEKYNGWKTNGEENKVEVIFNLPPKISSPIIQNDKPLPQKNISKEPTKIVPQKSPIKNNPTSNPKIPTKNVSSSQNNLTRQRKTSLNVIFL